MKVKEHSHLRGQNGCLGFFYGLDALLSAYPEGGLPGEFFVNGKTQSIWVWDATGRSWYDSNHAAPAPFFGIITDTNSFSPNVESGKEACFVYIAGHAGSYHFLALKGVSPLTVTTTSAAVIVLVWDGTTWRDYVTPISLDDAVHLSYMYRGSWTESSTYIYADGFTDVVYYLGKYYRVKQAGSVTGEIPDESDKWEEVTHFYAVADQLYFPTGQLIVLDRQQAIRVKGFGSTWELGDGIIHHLETGTFLSTAGELRVPAGGDSEIVISPIERGIKFWRNNKEVLIIDWDNNGQVRLAMSQFDDSGSRELSISPQQITLSQLDSAGQTLNTSQLSLNGLNCRLKQWSDTLVEGDIYVDENNVLKQKRG